MPYVTGHGDASSAIGGLKELPRNALYGSWGEPPVPSILSLSGTCFHNIRDLNKRMAGCGANQFNHHKAELTYACLTATRIWQGHEFHEMGVP